MTSPLQREALATLGEVWEMSPDVRLGQLFANLGFLGESHLGRGLGYLEDDEMVAILYRQKAELLARLEGSSHPEFSDAAEAKSISGSAILRDVSPAADPGCSAV
jgi:hypothetical protein